MSKFTKYNNPKKRTQKRRSAYSREYQRNMKDEMYRLLADAETDAEKDAIIKAYNISMNL